MKKTIALFLALAAFTASAQTNKPVTITGTMDINFKSKTTPGKGVRDQYDVTVNFSDSALFHGTIYDQPQIIERKSWSLAQGVTQPRILEYALDLDVINPHDPTHRQTKNVGQMSGFVPISSDGVYHYDEGSLVVDTIQIGLAPGLHSKFDGTAAGKPLNRPKDWDWHSLVCKPVTVTRSVNGKVSAVVVAKYDKMDFHSVVLAEGPVQIYQPVTVNGQMLYDYDKNCWFFNNFSVQYAEGRDLKVDRVTGTIRWVEDPNRKSNGLGHYDFDIRVNEPAPDASSAFAAPSDESAFFSTDATVPGLTGTMAYKDNLNAGGDTLSSAVTIDLNGNNINKQQVMVLAKVIIFASVIPMNSD